MNNVKNIHIAFPDVTFNIKIDNATSVYDQIRNYLWKEHLSGDL